MQLHGIHHVTAVTSHPKQNVDFYTRVLGLRLVKKTVNQDDVSAYHLFYADKVGSPGTDMTFFDWAHVGQNRWGTDSVVNTQFRVSGRAALEYWVERFNQLGVPNKGVETFGGRDGVRFEDPEQQHLTLVDDYGADFHGVPWDATDIPLEYTIRGFNGVSLAIPRLEMIQPILTEVLGFTFKERHPSLSNPEEFISIFTMDDGGPGKEVHVAEWPNHQRGILGRGGVHHVAFRVKDDDEHRAWVQRLRQMGVPTSGVIDRFYFKSLYFRISNGILFELATDEPGFTADEPLETLGEKLALPPFLEPQRAQIEAGLLPIE